MSRFFKKSAKMVLSFILLLCAFAGLLSWRLTSIAVEPMEPAVKYPTITLASDTLEIGLPSLFFEKTELTYSLLWPDYRLFFSELNSDDRNIVNLYSAGLSLTRFGEQVDKEDVSELLGHPATMTIQFDDKRSRDCSGDSRPDDPGDTICLHMALTIRSLKEAMFFEHISGPDYAPAEANLHNLNLEAQKTEFIERVREFLSSYTQLEESMPPSGAAGYRTGSGFIVRTGSENYIVSLDTARFQSSDLNLQITRDRIDCGLLFHMLPDANKSKLRVLLDWLYHTGKIVGYNRYSVKAGGVDGLEHLLLIPYTLSKPRIFHIVWQEAAKSGHPEEAVLGLSMDNFTSIELSVEDWPEKMAIWRSLLNSLHIKRIYSE